MAHILPPAPTADDEAFNLLQAEHNAAKLEHTMHSKKIQHIRCCQGDGNQGCYLCSMLTLDHLHSGHTGSYHSHAHR